MHEDYVELACVYTQQRRKMSFDTLVLVTGRESNDALYYEVANDEKLEASGIKTLTCIGDCHVPGALVHAVYDGHRCARTLEERAETEERRRERVCVGLEAPVLTRVQGR